MTALAPDVELALFPAHGRGAFLVSPRLQTWLSRNGSAFDAVHVHGLLNPVSSLASRSCVRNRWPLVLRPFGTLSRFTFTHRRALLKRAYMTLIEESNLKHASAIHFTTNAERDASEWHGIVWGARARVVPPPWIGGAIARQITSDESSTVLFLSRLHPVKNIELLFEAWPAVLDRAPDARLVIAGDGDLAYTRTLQARAESLGESVTFVGHIDGVAKDRLLATAAVFVLPSFHENFGISVLEALAAGLPAILTAEVQLSDFVTVNALGVVAERSAPAFAAAIASVLENGALRRRCAADGPAIVARCFSPVVIGDALLQTYRFAIDHSSAEAVTQ